MAFQKIKPIRTADEYLDSAFKKAKKKADQIKSRSQTKKQEEIGKIKNLDVRRLQEIKNYLTKEMDGITEAFPQLDELTPFYKELLQCFLDYFLLKKALGAVNWARKRTYLLHEEYSTKIKRTQQVGRVHTLRKQFYGRISSTYKQIKKALDYLEAARRVMKELPVVRELPTVCIAGFPNAGKSTLLRNITSSKPEVQAYAFTTKKLNIGYLPVKENKKGIQVIDTPGTLNRFDKMNNIEKQSYLAMKYLADIIVYVFDPTEEYSEDMQRRLYARIKKYEKPVITYLSKTDMELEEKQLKKFEKYKPITDEKKLITMLTQQLPS